MDIVKEIHRDFDSQVLVAPHDPSNEHLPNRRPKNNESKSHLDGIRAVHAGVYPSRRHFEEVKDADAEADVVENLAKRAVNLGEMAKMESQIGTLLAYFRFRASVTATFRVLPNSVGWTCTTSFSTERMNMAEALARRPLKSMS